MPKGHYERKPLQYARTQYTKAEMKIKRLEQQYAEAIRYKTECKQLVDQLEAENKKTNN